jgi:1,2-diacylglycerol 3-beta-glucosyltransferase
VGSRLLAGGILLASAGIAWLAISLTLAARLLQAAIGLSMLYVGYLAWRGYLSMGEAMTARTEESDADLPFVLVLVPARNEAPVIGATVAALAALRYGMGERRYRVVVVDDGSSDGTGRLAAAAASDVTVVRREPGSGPATKAAVLAFAAASADAARDEVLAVIDADTQIAPDFLLRAVRAWRRDPTASALQVQRRAANQGAGWLVAAQDEEQLMDMASQCGRRATGGTAELRGNGMLVRLDALERLGGWNQAALTEDLDLSTRLAAAGEHVALAPEVEVREEAVERADALWRQRLRWAEGSLRRLLEHGPGLLGNPSVRLTRKLDFVAFGAEFLIPPLFVTTILASLATVVLPQPADWSVPLSLFGGYGIGTFLLAMAGQAAHGVRGLALLGRSVRGSLFLSHWLLVVPAALWRIAFLAPSAVFVQTPRRGHSA